LANLFALGLKDGERRRPKARPFWPMLRRE
jgi:hypothetical protein